MFSDFVDRTEANLQALAQRFLLLVRFRFAFDPFPVRFWFALDRWFARQFDFDPDLVRRRAVGRKKNFGQD